MTQNTYNEMLKKSYDKKVFSYCDKGKFYVCEDIGQLPYQNGTLQHYIDSLVASYDNKIKDMEHNLENQSLAIKQLQNAIAILNK